MENTTSRLAVRVTKHPPFEFQWSDTSSQQSRSELDETDILPSEADGACLHARMVKFMMSFMVKELVSLSDLAQFVPSDSSPPVQKSEVVPLKLLFRDEKSIDETIQILVHYIKDAHLDGTPQVDIPTVQVMYIQCYVFALNI